MMEREKDTDWLTEWKFSVCFTHEAGVVCLNFGFLSSISAIFRRSSQMNIAFELIDLLNKSALKIIYTLSF